MPQQEIPEVGLIEAAIDTLKGDPDIETRVRTIQAFQQLGTEGLKRIRTIPQTAGYTNLELGYLVGLEVARLFFTMTGDRG